ncbi:sentrin-specific protease 1-like [Adelges cooleyi]|uniref:sentrin-specific protease 1-like n=1 Tax=Adelges cooleyi TaxID=133065 RepID=UPI00217F4513|nr:sentrin-specific protease 1-like [Adelges cooleyi]
MGFFSSLRSIKKWFTDKTGLTGTQEVTKRKHDDCEPVANKRARMDDSLVEVVEISDESLSETEEVEITEPGPSTVPLRASPPVFLSDQRHFQRRTLSPFTMIDLTSSSDDEKKTKHARYSLANPSQFSSRTKQLVRSASSSSTMFKRTNSPSMEHSFSSLHINKTSTHSDSERILGLILKNYALPKSKSEALELSTSCSTSPVSIHKQNTMNQTNMSNKSGKENVNIPELSFYKNRKIEQETFYNRILRKFREKQAASTLISDRQKKSSDDVFLEKLQTMNKEIEKIEPKKKQEVFPGYSKEVTDFISQKMSGPQNEFIVKGKNIKKSDLRTIYSPTAWLNDEVINHYMNMIVDRDPKSLHTFDTFFYTKLSSQGYESVRRWSRKKDIFACKKMFSPIHLGNHWCLICVNFIEKTIKYYDSLGGTNPKCLNAIMYYLKEEHKNKKNSELDCSGWRLMEANDCPKQRNGYDCGVFACINAEFLSRDAKLDFTQEDMPQLRHRVCYEILRNRLCF